MCNSIHCWKHFSFITWIANLVVNINLSMHGGGLVICAICRLKIKYIMYLDWHQLHGNLETYPWTLGSITGSPPLSFYTFFSLPFPYLPSPLPQTIKELKRTLFRHQSEQYIPQSDVFSSEPSPQSFSVSQMEVLVTHKPLSHLNS